jgi:haloacid dehalogenase-like hydrolase
VPDDALRLQERGATVTVLGEDQRAIAVFGLADAPRPDARDAVDGLHRAGIRHVVMLTGDHERATAAIAEDVGVDEQSRRPAARGQAPGHRGARRRRRPGRSRRGWLTSSASQSRPPVERKPRTGRLTAGSPRPPRPTQTRLVQPKQEPAER